MKSVYEKVDKVSIFFYLNFVVEKSLNFVCLNLYEPCSKGKGSILQVYLEQWSLGENIAKFYCIKEFC